MGHQPSVRALSACFTKTSCTNSGIEPYSLNYKRKYRCGALFAISSVTGNAILDGKAIRYTQIRSVEK